MNLFADDLRCAVAALHDGGAVADGGRFEHVELLAGEGDKAARTDGFLLHEGDGFGALDRHDGIDQVEGGVEAASEGVDFEYDVVRIFLEGVGDGAGAEIVHGRFHVAFELDPHGALLICSYSGGSCATDRICSRICHDGLSCGIDRCGRGGVCEPECGGKHQNRENLGKKLHVYNV